MPCHRCITLDDTHKLCVICLGAEHTLSALEGAGCAYCDRFTVKNLCFYLALINGGWEPGVCATRVGLRHCLYVYP